MFTKLQKNKWLSRLLLIAMLFTLLPAPVWAEGEEPDSLITAAPENFDANIKSDTLPPEIVAALNWEAPTLADPFGSAKDYNIFLLGADSGATLKDFHECEGPAAINGNIDNLTGQLSFSPSPWTGVGQPTTSDMLIGTIANGTITNGRIPMMVGIGSLLCADDIDRSVDFQGNGGIIYTHQADTLNSFFAQALSDLYTMNKTLLALPENASISNNDADWLTLIGDPQANTQVFNIDLTGITKPWTITNTQNIEPTDHIIFNISSSSPTVDFKISTLSGLLNHEDKFSRVIFNFAPNITKINLNGVSPVPGSIYAPNADVEAFSGGVSINGYLVARSLTGFSGFECHWFPWDTQEPAIPEYPSLILTKNIALSSATSKLPTNETAFTFQVVNTSGEIFVSKEVTIPAGEAQVKVAIEAADWDTAALNDAFAENTSLALTLQEVAGEDEHWQYDSSSYSFTLTKEGIDYVISEPEAMPELVFTNTYVNDPVTIPVSKQVINPSLADQMLAYIPDGAAFTVQLLDGQAEAASVTLSAATDWAGSLSVEKPIRGIKTYTLHEIAPDPLPAGWQYAEDIPVSVRADGTITYDGKLLSDNDPLVITNIYNSAELVVSKMLVNTPAGTTLNDLAFTFGLFADENAAVPLRTATVVYKDVTAKALFTDIPAPLAKNETFTYYLKELTDEPISGWQYDDTVYTITVDSQGQITWDGAYGAELTFTNVHKAAVSFTKMVEAQGFNAALPEEYTFTFTLTPQAGTPGDAQTVTLTKSKDGQFAGKGAFTDLPVPLEGTHTYLLTEVKGSAPGWQYDDTVYTVTIDSQGQVTITQPEIEKTSAVFHNIYKTPTQITMQKVMRYRHNGVWAPIPKGDYTFRFTLYRDEALTQTVGTAQATLHSNGSQDTISAPLSFLPDTDFAILPDGVYYVQEEPLADSH